MQEKPQQLHLNVDVERSPSGGLSGAQTPVNSSTSPEPSIPYHVFSSRVKLTLVLVVSLVATLSGLSSNIFFPSIQTIARVSLSAMIPSLSLISRDPVLISRGAGICNRVQNNKLLDHNLSRRTRDSALFLEPARRPFRQENGPHHNVSDIPGCKCCVSTRTRHRGSAGVQSFTGHRELKHHLAWCRRHCGFRGCFRARGLYWDLLRW